VAHLHLPAAGFVAEAGFTDGLLAEMITGPASTKRHTMLCALQQAQHALPDCLTDSSNKAHSSQVQDILGFLLIEAGAASAADACLDAALVFLVGCGEGDCRSSAGFLCVQNKGVGTALKQQRL
jgi:hypothetical protein